MGGDSVAASLFDVADHDLEPLIREGLDFAAAVADKVMVMVFVGPDRLEASHPVAEIEPLQKTLLGKRVEYAIDACEADRSAESAKFIVDLLRAEAAGLLVEEPDHREASRSASVAGRSQLCERALRPGGRAFCHPKDGNHSRHS